jgi:hypothetical protein
VSLLHGVCVTSQLPFRQACPTGQRSVVEQSSHLRVCGLQTFPLAQVPPSPQSGSVPRGMQARSRQIRPSPQSSAVAHSSGPQNPVARQVEAPGQSMREVQAVFSQRPLVPQF